ncbi:MAG: patatin-like phospholipase family protein [Candidatus Omnitrophota bacterium]
MDNKDVQFIITNTPPFNKLKPEELAQFIALSEVKAYRNGDIIYHNGDAGEYFYFLLAGRVAILNSDYSRDAEIETLKRGTCFGIISLFNDEPHSVTAKSTGISWVLLVKKDAFKEFLHAHAMLSLEFYRILSQRIRTRAKPKKIFQCKRIAVFGFPLSGKTTYVVHLGRELIEQTKKKVICVEFSLENNFSLPEVLGKEAKPLELEAFSEEQIEEHIVHDSVDGLLVKIVNGSNILSLLNCLYERYHFIVYEIPSVLGDMYLYDMVEPCDYLHILLSGHNEEFTALAHTIAALKEKSPINQEKIKIIVNESATKDMSSQEMVRLLRHPLYATLPVLASDDYIKMMRRIARQTAEVVVGLALGSGAAYGLSHIGVLKVLEAHEIPIDIICGSSIGAVIASLWACGYAVSDIEAICKDFAKRGNLFSFSGISFPFRGFFRIKRLEKVLRDIFKDRTFYDVKRTLKIVAFDFYKRETRVLEEGLLYKALAASCAMPGIFEPVRFKEDILLDGGILNPLPTKVLLGYGVNKIIAVNITPSKEEIFNTYRKKNSLHILDFIFGSIETMQGEFVQQAISVADVVIHPKLNGLGWMEFDKIGPFIQRGEEAAREKLQDMKRLC